MSQKKEDIYVVSTGTRILHAVKTKKQAERFITDFNNAFSQISEEANVLYEPLIYKKCKLIWPRDFTEKQMSTVKKVLSNKTLSNKTETQEEKIK